MYIYIYISATGLAPVWAFVVFSLGWSILAFTLSSFFAFKRNSSSWELFLGAPGAPARSGLTPPFLVQNDTIKKTTTNMANATDKSQKCSHKCHFFMVLLTRILKCENVFGLHRRERIEVQAILKTAKKWQKNDMQTNAYTHLRFSWKSVGKAVKKE